MSNSSYQILVLAAGKGVRMRSALPKVLHKLCGRTLLERTLRAALGASPKRITVVVGFGEDLVRKELTRIGELPEFSAISIEAVVQQEQNGTGHAVQLALPAITKSNERVIIVPGDCPLLQAGTLSEISAADNKLGYPPILVVSATVPNPHGFGRILRDASGAVTRIVEEKDCSDSERKVREINSSIYSVEPKFLAESVKNLKADNAQRELYLPDIIATAVSKGLGVHAHVVADHKRILGANTRWELLQLEVEQRAELIRRHLDNGVTFESVDNIFIDEDVTIGADSFIGSGSRLHGTTGIGERVIVEGDSLIRNSSIANDTLIRLGCYIDQSVVESDCRVGPFAQLRPGTTLRAGVHVGNFVEVKNSELAAGAKANHLTYIGDATVGERANIGAGTITCNYDGYKKYRTEIGAGAFIGSNTSLVAPVRVGVGAVTGAGSVITKEVPDDSLAVERSEQKNINGWSKRRRENQEKR